MLKPDIGVVFYVSGVGEFNRDRAEQVRQMSLKAWTIWAVRACLRLRFRNHHTEFEVCMSHFRLITMKFADSGNIENDTKIMLYHFPTQSLKKFG